MRLEELEVYLERMLVGHLRQASYNVSFTFAESYLSSYPRPVLGQWFEDRLHDGPFREVHGGMPNFFENLLPSDMLRRLIKLQHQLDEPTDLDLLAVLGEDLPGATVLRDPRQEVAVGFEDAPSVLMDSLTDGGPLLRFSLAGLQLKFSLIKQGEILTLPATGEHGSWIVKIPVMRDLRGIVENEHTVMNWAREAGFDVPICQIIRASQMKGVPHQIDDETAIYSIERFDRVGSQRVHAEDLAQALGISSDNAISSGVRFDYGGLGLIIRSLLGTPGLEQYFRRIALMIAAGNEDAHLKNWSILYQNGRTPTWSPVYDQVSTVAWGTGRSRGPALAVGAARYWHELDTLAIERFLRQSDFDSMRGLRIIDETLETLRDAWRTTQGAAQMLAEHRTALSRHWAATPLLKRFSPLS